MAAYLSRVSSIDSVTAATSALPPEKSSAAAHVLIVEDNADLAFGLQRTLEAQGHTVDVVGSGREALDRVKGVTPALIILDLMIPPPDGYAVLAELRRHGCMVPVLILSARGEEADKVRGFRAGADDYVTKPFGVLELVERVQALLRRSQGSVASMPEGRRFGRVLVDDVGRRAWRDGEPVTLSPLEFALLLTFLRQPGVVLSRATLLRDVWGHAPDIQTRTVDLHISELRRKIEPEPSRPRHIVTVFKTGYRFDP